MYTCETCGAMVRTRQGLGGHIRFRHSEVKAPANRRPHTPTTFERETAAKLTRLEESIERLAGLISQLGMVACNIAEQTAGIDPDLIFDYKSGFLSTSLFGLSKGAPKYGHTVQDQVLQRRFLNALIRRAEQRLASMRG